jgi:hypothetical protein
MGNMNNIKKMPRSTSFEIIFRDSSLKIELVSPEGFRCDAHIVDFGCFSTKSLGEIVLKSLLLILFESIRLLFKTK